MHTSAVMIVGIVFFISLGSGILLKVFSESALLTKTG